MASHVPFGDSSPSGEARWIGLGRKGRQWAPIVASSELVRKPSAASPISCQSAIMSRSQVAFDLSRTTVAFGCCEVSTLASTCSVEITVGNNVFIGLGSIILPGVTIGDDVVIGAGSLVNKDIPSQSVAAGVPAKVVSSLEDYRQRSVARGLFTKGLSPEAKRYHVLSAMPFDAAE